jgi:hypothetical protein
MKDQNSMMEKRPLKQDDSMIKYQNIAPGTNRSQIIVQEDPMMGNSRIEPGQMVKPIIEAKPVVLQGKPIQLQLKPMILQNPQTQLFNPMSNFSVCPFCKYSGSLDITYANSKTQRTYCILLIIFGLFFLAWIPFLIKDLSVQILKCSNCQKELKQGEGENELA